MITRVFHGHNCFAVCYLPLSKEEDEIRRERERVLKIFHEIEREIVQTCSSVGLKIPSPPHPPPPPPEGALPKMAYTWKLRPTAYIFSGFRYLKSGNSLIQAYRKGGKIKSSISVKGRKIRLKDSSWAVKRTRKLSGLVNYSFI